MSQQTAEPQDCTFYLPATGTWPASWYLLDQHSRDAIDLAVACGRPLLVRGLPGTGKSDLARAAAEYLERAFVYEVVTARTEPQDLLWRIDAIARLSDAQVQGAGRKPGAADPSEPRHYLSPGALWWAIAWQAAEDQIENHCKTAAQRPDSTLQLSDGSNVTQQQRAEKNSCVLLLDEIDKADSELPNSLLEVLANTGFRLPWGGGYVKNDVNKPLIVVTTNEDRELPPAFVRRCLVLNIETEQNFVDWIKKRARVHFRDPEAESADDTRPALAQSILDNAAEELHKERTENRPGDSHLPGLAEYLDLLRGLYHLAPDNTARQQDWLNRVYRFAYRKHAPGA
jgi:MoxR-like ATPase